MSKQETEESQGSNKKPGVAFMHRSFELAQQDVNSTMAALSASAHKINI